VVVFLSVPADVLAHGRRDEGDGTDRPTGGGTMSRPRSVMVDGPAVVVSGRFAFWLDRTVNLRKLAIDVRGLDPEISEALDAILLAAFTARQATSAVGSKQDNRAEVASHSEHVSTTTAADILDCTDRAVRLACSQGRLSGRCVDGRWQVDRLDLERFAGQRNG
jgi:hypothetical protein